MGFRYIPPRFCLLNDIKPLPKGHGQIYGLRGVFVEGLLTTGLGDLLEQEFFKAGIANGKIIRLKKLPIRKEFTPGGGRIAVEGVEARGLVWEPIDPFPLRLLDELEEAGADLDRIEVGF